MKPFVTGLLGKKASELHPDYKINCFNTVISYFNNQISDGKISAQAMLEWLQVNTEQVEIIDVETILVVWSSSDIAASPQTIKINRLKKEIEGYPFGLVMEHAAVFVTKTEVFQKASPSDDHKFEIVHYSQILTKDYSHLPWIRSTFHKIKLDLV